jgi:hypothetical protein
MLPADEATAKSQLNGIRLTPTLVALLITFQTVSVFTILFYLYLFGYHTYIVTIF